MIGENSRSKEEVPNSNSVNFAQSFWDARLFLRKGKKNDCNSWNSLLFWLFILINDYLNFVLSYIHSYSCELKPLRVIAFHAHTKNEIYLILFGSCSTINSCKNGKIEFWEIRFWEIPSSNSTTTFKTQNGKKIRWYSLHVLYMRKWCWINIKKNSFSLRIILKGIVMLQIFLA